ncbi:MAG: hypothetical protein WDN46_04710 [Methylocella sp.]
MKRLEEKVNEQARKQKETHAQIFNLPAKIAPVEAPSGTTASSGVGIAPLEDNLPQDLAARMAAIRGVPIANLHSVYFNGITFTPGGFIALEGVFRDRFVGADIATPFAAIPFGNVRAGNANEFRLTSRQSRPSLLAKGDVNPTTHWTAFAEIDFLGAAQTANSDESNSFNPRLRQFYASVDQDDFGAHLLVGQAWSFATAFLNGLNPRQENIPLTIEHQFIPGFVWARQPQIRVVKDFGDNVSVGLSIENPQTTFASGPGAPAGPFLNGQPTAGAAAALPSSLVFNQLPPDGSLFNSSNAVSLNHMPDIIGKVAWDPRIADRHIHIETTGIFRDFYSQVDNHNQDVAAGGVGASILIPLISNTLELQFSSLTGRGIGRYGTSGLPDVTFNSSGAITPLQETMLLAGLNWRATPQLDLYAYAGEERESASFNTVTTPIGAKQAFGYGNPLYTNAGCAIPGSSACVGDVALVRQLTVGFWDRIYSGPMGQLRVGMQYSFTQKYSFAGVGGTAKAQENIVLGSFRYYPFGTH